MCVDVFSPSKQALLCRFGGRNGKGLMQLLLNWRISVGGDDVKPRQDSVAAAVQL